MPDQPGQPDQPYREAQDRMRHTPSPEEPAAPLPTGEAGPLNDQGSPEFNVGGVERALSPKEQLEQLVSYMNATYPAPDTTPPWEGGTGDPAEADRYMGHLADRITHASMLMLGSAVDHTMPGVAYTDKISQKSCELGEIFGNSTSWIISLWDGPHVAKDHFFRPEAAALAQLSGCTVLDVDDVGDASSAVAFARNSGAKTVAVWAFSSGCDYVPKDIDKVAFTFPTKVVRLDVPTFTQVGTEDSIGMKIEGAQTYHSTHYIQTPAEARRKVRDLAEFFRA